MAENGKAKYNALMEQKKTEKLRNYKQKCKIVIC